MVKYIAEAALLRGSDTEMSLVCWESELVERVAGIPEAWDSCRCHLPRLLRGSELLEGVQQTVLRPGTGDDGTVSLRRGND